MVSTLFSVCPFVEYFSAQSLNTVPMKYSLLDELIKFNLLYLFEATVS